MATFNGAAHLPRQLRSITAQERLPDELIISDDASTDGTRQLLHDFVADAPFPVRVLSNDRRLGSTTNFESAIAAAGGDVIAPCDQDDVWYPEKLKRIEAAFEAAPRPGLAFSDADVVDQQLRPLGYTLWKNLGFDDRLQRAAAAGDLTRILLRFNVVTGTAMAFDAKWRELILPIPTCWVHDAWTALMIAAVAPCVPIAQPLLAYRQHAAQQIGSGRLTIGRQIELARQMDVAYFARETEKFHAAVERLELWQDKGVRPQVLKRVQEKAAHAAARARMHSTASPARFGRWRAIAAEAVRGRYCSYSLGLKSVAQDVFL